MEKGSILGLAHIGVFVTDIQRSKAFYQDVLEFSCIYEFTMADQTQIAFMQNGDCVIELVCFANPERRGDGVVDHIALKVRNIEAVHKTLIERGLTTYDSPHIIHCPECFPNGAKWILFRGPDGEHLEITEIL